MQQYKRNGNKWSVNEILNLQREYELLEWNIQQIASKHQRSVQAILYKLESECFISSWNAARGLDEWKNSNGYNEETEEDDDISDYNVSKDEEEEEDGDSEYNEDDNKIEVTYANECEIDKLTERVWGLETSVDQISSMVKQMFDTMVASQPKGKSRQKLRNY
jgi:hypothetical protein